MFTAVELADMRAEQTASLDKTCVVSTPAAQVDDAAGGTTEGSPTTASVACRIGPPRASDQSIADRLGIVVDTVLTLPYGTSVSDRGTITNGGRSYEVTHVNTEQSYQAAVRVFARSIRSNA